MGVRSHFPDDRDLVHLPFQARLLRGAFPWAQPCSTSGLLTPISYQFLCRAIDPEGPSYKLLLPWTYIFLWWSDLIFTCLRITLPAREISLEGKTCVQFSPLYPSPLPLANTSSRQVVAKEHYCGYSVSCFLWDRFLVFFHVHFVFTFGCCHICLQLPVECGEFESVWEGAGSGSWGHGTVSKTLSASSSSVWWEGQDEVTSVSHSSSDYFGSMRTWQFLKKYINYMGLNRLAVGGWGFRIIQQDEFSGRPPEE